MHKHLLVSILAISVLMTSALACSSDDEADTPAAAADTGSAPPAAAAAADAEPDPNARGGAIGLGEFGEYLVTQNYELSIAVSSTKFDHRRRIPRQYGCEPVKRDGPVENISPPITWGDVPAGTVSIAVTVDSDQNPGARWSHLVLWGLAPDVRGLQENVTKAHEVPELGPAARHGTNDDDTIGWSGPCPPLVRLDWTGSDGSKGMALDDPVKNYTFAVFALDTRITLGPETTKDDLLKTIDGHIIGAGEVTGQQVSKKKDPMAN
jgi:hypothetical protein